MSAPFDISGFVVEIEQDVLGLLLLGCDSRRVTGFLRADHFLEPLHSYLYDKMVLTRERYGSMSPVIVFKTIPKDEASTLGAKLGKSLSAYLAELASNTASGPAYLETAARKVVEQWARIRIGEEGERIKSISVDPAANASDLLKALSASIDDLSTDLRVGGRRRTRLSIGQASETALAEVRAAMESKTGLTGTTWGLTDVNRFTGGIHRGEMVIIGARPSMGKTAIAGSVAIRAARSGAGVGFVSLEMGASRIAMRALTDIAYDRHAKIAYSDLITGRVGQQEFDQITWAQEDLKVLPLIFEEQGGLTVGELRVKIERIADDLRQRGHTLDVLVVDYLQLLLPSARYSGNRTAEITEISGALRNFAHEFDCGVVALSQLSRQVESRDDKRPQLSDLRESGSIEQDADAVIFLFREAYYLQKAKGKDKDKEDARIERLAEVENKLEFIIAKQRNGPTKTVDLFVDIACSAVRNAAVT